MDFTRKSRLLLDGHKTPNPIGSTCIGVVSRDSMQITFTYAALNGLNVCVPTSKLHHLKRIILYADPSLGSIM